MPLELSRRFRSLCAGSSRVLTSWKAWRLNDLKAIAPVTKHASGVPTSMGLV